MDWELLSFIFNSWTCPFFVMTAIFLWLELGNPQRINCAKIISSQKSSVISGWHLKEREVDLKRLPGSFNLIVLRTCRELYNYERELKFFIRLFQPIKQQKNLSRLLRLRFLYPKASFLFLLFLSRFIFRQSMKVLAQNSLQLISMCVWIAFPTSFNHRKHHHLCDIFLENEQF